MVDGAVGSFVVISGAYPLEAKVFTPGRNVQLADRSY